MKKSLFVFVSLIWFGAMSWGLFYLMRYSNTPGAAAHAPAHWPADSSLERSQETATLVLFGHPQCPCTRASMGELNEIMAKAPHRLKVLVAFVLPKGAGEDWRHSDLWEEGQRIPGVKTLVDEDGVEAQRFDAKTSGQAMLYDERGQLVFSGGITDARGHAGENVGKSAVIAFANERRIISHSTPVFGCALYARDERGSNE